jgi:transcriptional regulator with XRE-family HTH domain
MHSNEIRDQFIELRSQNVSLRQIADQLGVHRNTLLEWDRLYSYDIRRLRRIEREALLERILPKTERQLTDVVEEYDRVTAHATTAFLARRQLALLARIDKMRMLPS